MNDAYFMREAIKDAQLYGHRFGAILVKNNKIIALSGNRPQSDPRFHAETQAILNAGKDLEGCTLYTTCEPCPMCFYMAWVTHVSRLVYGATLVDSLAAGFSEINLSVEELNNKVNNILEIKKGVLREECITLLLNK
jgi:guanine deaminase